MLQCPEQLCEKDLLNHYTQNLEPLPETLEWKNS